MIAVFVRQSVCHAAQLGGAFSVCRAFAAAFAQLLWPLVIQRREIFLLWSRLLRFKKFLKIVRNVFASVSHTMVNEPWYTYHGRTMVEPWCHRRFNAFLRHMANRGISGHEMVSCSYIDQMQPKV